VLEAARPKLLDGYIKIPSVTPAFCWAGAGLLLTPTDCARFGAALLDSPEAKIDPAERALLFTPLTEAAENSPPLGLGWRVDHDAKGRLRWHHAGTTPGGRYGLVIYPEPGLSVALAGNTMLAPPDVLGPSAGLADLFG
jgi:serine beta-lactamase-like protein LACTB, mitochondrial